MLVSELAGDLRYLMIVESVRGKVLIELLPAERKLLHRPSLNVKMIRGLSTERLILTPQE